MKDTDKNIKFQKEIITESVNGRIVILESQHFKSANICEKSTVKIINLLGQWPQGPTVLKRKNYPTLLQFVQQNKNNKKTSIFIKDAIQDFVKLSSYQILAQCTENRSKIFSHQIFVSNSGQRISFWLQQQNFKTLFNILVKLQYTHLLEKFQWISLELQQVNSNQIQYGSHNFINIIEKLSLKSVSEIIGLKNYSQNEFSEISQSFHNVFSLVNYNYRYFYPPKDATRFLKKTSGVVLLSRQQLKQQKSNKWAESVLLQSIFQLRPTFILAKIFSQSHGPLYLEKYVFSERMYETIEGLYFLGNIENLFHQDNIRNELKYLTFISRIFPSYLVLQQSKQIIQKLKKDGLIKQDKQQVFSYVNEECEDDSEDQVQISANKQQNQISKRYNSSKKKIDEQIRRQLVMGLNKFRETKSIKSSLEQLQLDKVKSFNQISWLRQSCLHINVKLCNSCGYSYSKITNQQDSFDEFLNMFNEGSDTYCISCSHLSVKDKIIAAKQMTKQQLQNQKVISQKSKQKQQTIQANNDQKQQSNQNQKQNYLSLQQSIMKKQNKTQQTQTKSTELQNKPETIKIQSNQHQQTQPNQPIIQKIQLNSQETNNQKSTKTTNQNQPLNKIIQKLQNKQEITQIAVRIERQPLLADQQIRAFGLITLASRGNPTQKFETGFVFDTLQLSKLSGILTSQKFISDQLLDIYQLYFNEMIKYINIYSHKLQKQIILIPNLNKNIFAIKQRKYLKILSNVLSFVFSKTLNLSQQKTQLFSIQNEKKSFTDHLYEFLEIRLQNYKNIISEHYKTYKNVMNQQYRVTQIELKEMIVQFQQNLKLSIIKTTQQFLLTARWIVLFISEYSQYKTLKIKQNKVQPEELNQIAYFINQIQFLLNLIATFVHVFNQPGQAKIIEQVQKQILDVIFLLIQNQRSIQKNVNLSSQMDFEVIGVLIGDMLEYFVSKRTSQATQDAKKLTNKHFAKVKLILQAKIKGLKVNRILNFSQQIRNLQMKIASQSLMEYSKKEIQIVKNLYVDGQLNPTPGYFSSLIYLQKYFEKHESSLLTNDQIRTHISMLSMVLSYCHGNQNLTLKSKSEPQHKIRFSIIYKLILQSIRKSDQVTELIAVFRSGNTILIDLINYFLHTSFKIASQFIEQQQIAQDIKLYIERVRYRHLKYTSKKIKHYDEIGEILEFLFKNRNSFFKLENQTLFEIQFHMIIQIVILNALPLYNIELAFKSELKDINKELRHFDVNDRYNEIEDYYLKVISYRYDKAKEKRKKQLQSKKQKV